MNLMNVFMVAYIVISILIIVLVLAQKSRDNGFSTMTGAKPSDGREIGKTFEKKLQTWTTWLVVIYIILSIGFTFFQLKQSTDEEETFNSDDEIVDELDDENSESNTEVDTEVDTEAQEVE